VKFISIKLICLVLLLFYALKDDLLFYKIGNRIIATGILVGVGFQICELGWTSILTMLGGIFIPIFILFPLFLFKVLGAGDIKLFSVVGSFFGLQFVLKTIFISFVIGAIMSLYHLIKHNLMFQRLHYLVGYIQYVKQQNKDDLKNGFIAPYYNVKEHGYQGVIHFSIAIFLSFMLQITFKLL
jgi:prepilin peptidase CpaA